MLPILFKIGPVPIHAYGLMIAIGFLLALYFMQREAVKAGVDPKIFADGAFYTLILGIVGARFMHIVLYPQHYAWNDPLGWIAVWEGGLVFQGAIPPALLYVWWHFRRNELPFLKGVDIVMPYLALAHGVGRIGCFLNGCCYGKPSDVPWAIPFRRVPWDLDQAPTGSAPYLDHLRRFGDVTLNDHWSHPIHPTQLYAAFGLFGICAVLVVLKKKWNPFTGFTFPAYFVLYGTFRFVVEFFRGDHNPVHFANLTDQQVFSLILLAVGVALFLFLQNRSRQNAPAPTQ